MLLMMIETASPGNLRLFKANTGLLHYRFQLQTNYCRSWQLNGTLVVSLYRQIFYEQSHNTEGNWKNSNTFKNPNSQHPKKENLYRQFDGSWTNSLIFTVLNPKYYKSRPPAKNLDNSVPNNPSNFLCISRCVINMSSYEASVIH